jgi:hypothetical protein
MKQIVSVPLGNEICRKLKMIYDIRLPSDKRMEAMGAVLHDLTVTVTMTSPSLCAMVTPFVLTPVVTH